MPNLNFLFTYSVSPTSDETKKVQKANFIRKKIAEIEKEKWKKLDDVETTFAGKIYLESISTAKQRQEAEEIVTKELREIIDENDAFMDVWVSVALMVDGLGEFIELRI